MKDSSRSPLKDAGLWFAFFGVVYIVLLLKLSTGSYLNHNVFFGIYSIIIICYVFSRFILSYLHRGVPVAEGYEPTVSFVVPAKNEGENIYETLHRFSEVEYPKDKIEVIAINDG